MKNTIKLYQLEELLQAGVLKQFDESERRVYYVSKYGNFYSQSKRNPESITKMSFALDGAGYLRTNVNGRTQKAHIVVVETFNRPRKQGEVIHHLDNDRTNNNIENVIITTQSHNLQESWDLTKQRRRLSYEKAEQIRHLYKTKDLSMNALAKQFDCTATSVKQVIENRTFTKKLK